MLVCPYCEQQRHLSNGDRSFQSGLDTNTDDIDSGPKEENPKSKIVLYSSDQTMENEGNIGLCVHMGVPEQLNLETLIHYKEATCKVMSNRIQEIIPQIEYVVFQKELKLKEVVNKEKHRENIVSESYGSRLRIVSSEINGDATQLVAGSGASLIKLQRAMADNKMLPEVQDDITHAERPTKDIPTGPDSCSQGQGSEPLSLVKSRKRKSKLVIYRSDQAKEEQRNLVLEVFLERAEFLSSDTLCVYKEAACDIVVEKIHSIASEIEELVEQKKLELEELGNMECLRTAGLPEDTQNQKYKAPVTETKGIHNNWHQPILAGPETFYIVFNRTPTLAAFERSLETNMVYAVKSHRGVVIYSAKITYDQRKLHLHPLQASPPPPLSRIVQYEDLIKFLIGKNITTFMDLLWEGYLQARLRHIPQSCAQGRIHIKVRRGSAYGRIFRGLCTGELGLSYAGSRLLEVIDGGNSNSEAVLGGYYEHEIARNSLRFLGKVRENDSFEDTGGPGSVWAGYGSNEKPRGFQFGITTGQNVQRDRYDVVFGQVEKGLSIVREAARIPDIRAVKIVDCGVVLPILIWQFQSMIENSFLSNVKFES